jgi:hypothetical protein
MTTATLIRQTESGSYMHKITFNVLGEAVQITETMIDELMGDWIGRSQDRKIAIDEARAYYRDRKRMGYQAA